MEPIEAVLIPALGKPRRVTYSSLDELQALVGGYVECLAMARPLDGVMWLNEEGKIHRLPYNIIATNVAIIDSSDFVAGDVVVTGRINEGGDETNISQADAEFLLSLGTAVST